jgi:2-C-methyl-D-erythritol 4-phosphate cytidylyltransferase
MGFACAVIVAAGRGKRFGPAGERPKQFRILGGRPLLAWAVEAFERATSVNSLVLVTSPGFMDFLKNLVRRRGWRKVRAVVPGGAERADSVSAGLAAAPEEADVVLIHDAARPLVTAEIVDRVAGAARRTGVALAAWPVPDTLKLASPARGRFAPSPLVKTTISRKGLWLAQTPQAFRRDRLRALLRRPPGGKFTDDVQWAESRGWPVELVPASPRNFKVTRPEDWDMCRDLTQP